MILFFIGKVNLNKRHLINIFIFFALFLFPFCSEATEKDRTLIVKGDHNYPPYEFLNKDGKPDGFNVQIIRTVAEQMGIKIRVELGNWSSVRAELEAGEIDALMGMFQTVERSKKVDFSIPHFIASYSVFVRKNSDIKSLDDIRNRLTLVQQDDLACDYLTENGITDQLIKKDTTEEVMLSLSAGKADCAVVSRLQGIIIIKKKNISNVKAVGSPIIQRKYCFAVVKGNSSLLAKLNEGLSILKTSGHYDRIYNKWFGVYEKDRWGYETVLKYTVMIASPLLLIIIGIFLWNWSLRIKVAKKTGELSDSRENLNITLNSIGDAVIATDTFSRVTRMNPVAEKLTGWSLNEARGRKLTQVFNIINSSTRESIGNPADRVLETGEIVGLANHTVLISKDGNEYQISDSGAPIKNSDDETTGVVLVFRDISEEHELQEQLKHSQKMDAIGQLAGGVAHDFNNLLTGIIGAAQLLEKRNTLLDPRSSDALKIILQAAARASDLTFKLLAFSRKGKIASTAINVKHTVDDTIAILKRTIDKRISIKFDYEAANSTVTGDSSELQNAFMNIGINASHAMPDGGTIHFSMNNVRLSRLYCQSSSFKITPGEYVEICIKDTGCGIPEENLLRIFEPFYTTKEQGKGTGLGLAAVYGTVLNHNGEVTVYSELNTGTSFHILLPCTEDETDDIKIQYEIKRGSGTILLVDDEEILRVTGSLMLQGMGYQVILAKDGREAVNIFRSRHHEIDLVLMDLIMPEMNGSEAFLKMQETDSNCRVIISSGFSRDENLTELKNKGLSGFIRKPYRDYELSQVIETTLNNVNKKKPAT